MAVRWHKTKYPGVRYREHPTRKHGIKKDRYFSIYYYRHGKRCDEALGWASGKKEGWTASKANAKRAELVEAIRTGEGLQSLKAKRKAVEEKEKAQEADALVFAEFFEEHYLPNCKASKIEKTWQREESLFRLWLAPAIGKLPRGKVAYLDIERMKRCMKTHKARPVINGAKGEYRMEKSENACSPRTINYALALVRQVYNFARKARFFLGNSPTIDVKKEKLANERLRYLKKKEAGRLLDALREASPIIADFATLSLSHGLRAGEIFGLKWKDLDLEAGLLTLWDTKNKKSYRIRLTKDSREIFEGMEKGKPSSLMFPDKNGKERTQVSKTFGTIVKHLGLNDGIDDRRERVCFHTLRHTFASWLVIAGVSLYVVKKLLRHSSITQTERYAHLAPNLLQDAMCRLPSLSGLLTSTDEPTPINKKREA